MSVCGRIGVGLGDDTWDPTCDLPAHHVGPCNWTGQTRILAPEPTIIRFEVEGHAMPGGSKKGFVDPKTRRVVVVEDSKNRPWRRQVAAAGMGAWQGAPLTSPLAVEFTFYRLRPRSHMGTGRNAEVLKRGMPLYPTSRPDVLKLARAAEDALTGVIWADDSQIVDERLRKLWGTRERLEVVVRTIG